MSKIILRTVLVYIIAYSSLVFGMDPAQEFNKKRVDFEHIRTELIALITETNLVIRKATVPQAVQQLINQHVNTAKTIKKEVDSLTSKAGKTKEDVELLQVLIEQYTDATHHLRLIFSDLIDHPGEALQQIRVNLEYQETLAAKGNLNLNDMSNDNLTQMASNIALLHDHGYIFPQLGNILQEEFQHRQNRSQQSMHQPPKPFTCENIPYKDWSGMVKQQSGATCGYYASWNLAQMLKYLQTHRIEETNKELAQGPDIGLWKDIISSRGGQLENIDDADMQYITFEVQGLTPDLVTIIPNLREWSPMLDETFYKVAKTLQTKPGSIHGFLVNTGGHTISNVGTLQSFGGHWTAIVAQNIDGIIHLHVADSAPDSKTKSFSNLNVLGQVYAWLTTEPRVLERLTFLSLSIQKIEKLLNTRPDQAQKMLQEINQAIAASPLQGSSHLYTNDLAAIQQLLYKMKKSQEPRHL